VLTNAPSGPLSIACLASIRLLPHAAPLCDEELTLHVGTCERAARVLPLGVASLAPGTTGPVLLHLSVPVATFAGQRVILRRSGLSHGATVAGGEILDPLPPRSKGAPRRLAPLAAELARSGRGRLEALAMAARADGLTRAELTWRLPPGGARGALEALTRSGELVAVGERLVHRSFIEEASRELVNLVVEHARDNPLSGGLPEQELLTRLVPPLRPLVAQALALAREKGRIEVAGATVRLPSQAPGAAAARPEATRLLGFYREQRFTPPTDDEAVLALGQPVKRVQDLLAALRRDGLLIKVATGLHYDPAAVEEITQRVLAALREKPELTAGDFKELLGGVSRKYAIPLLEFLDHGRVTMRVGNNRKLHPSRRS
jgi:selenocysteine-specific elongation factor